MALDPKRVRKTARKLRKLMKKARKRPTVDQIHSLRTNIRRFETAVEALRAKPKRDERRLLRDLHRVRSRAGKIRDMDVLTAVASSLQLPDEENCSVRLLQYLGARRYKQARKLYDRLKRDGSDASRQVKSVSARLVKRIPHSNSNDKGNSSAVAAALRLATELTAPPRLNHTNLHPYRLKVKELRDVLRLAENPENKAFIESLGEVKDAIGEWHDWEELATIAADVLDHGQGCKLLSKLRDIASEKYDRALELANKMRKQFLRSHDHKSPKPALVASMAVAS